MYRSTNRKELLPSSALFPFLSPFSFLFTYAIIALPRSAIFFGGFVKSSYLRKTNHLVVCGLVVSSLVDKVEGGRISVRLR